MLQNALPYTSPFGVAFDSCLLVFVLLPLAHGTLAGPAFPEQPLGKARKARERERRKKGGEIKKIHVEENAR